MIKNPLVSKHSHNNRESNIGDTMRLVREFKKLSLQDVAGKLSLKVAEVDHLENGRKFYTPEDVEKFINFYGITRENYDTLLNLKILNKQIVNHVLMSMKV